MGSMVVVVEGGGRTVHPSFVIGVLCFQKRVQLCVVVLKEVFCEVELFLNASARV